MQIPAQQNKGLFISGLAKQRSFPGANSQRHGNCSCICHTIPTSHTVPCCGPGSPGWETACDLFARAAAAEANKQVVGGAANK